MFDFSLIESILTPVSLLPQLNYPLPPKEKERDVFLPYQSPPHVFCSRCAQPFTPSYDLESPPPMECSYHSGSLRRPPKNSSSNNFEKVFSCCGGTLADSKGCEIGNWHVYSDENWEALNDKEPFVHVPEAALSKFQEPILALDCEMVQFLNSYLPFSFPPFRLNSISNTIIGVTRNGSFTSIFLSLLHFSL